MSHHRSRWCRWGPLRRRFAVVLTALSFIGLILPDQGIAQSGDGISTGGASWATERMSIGWTIGEAVAGVLENTGRILIVGIQQPTIREVTGLDAVSVPEMHLYPNPNAGILTLEAGTYPTDRTLRVYDVLGRERLEQRIEGSVPQRLDLSSLPAAMYFLTIFDGEQVQRTWTIVKTH